MDNQKYNFPGISCPKCGNVNFELDEKHPTRYYCPTKKGDSICGYAVYKCERCNKVYSKDHFGFRNDAYECKHCGMVQWDLTNEQRVLSALRSERSRLHDLLSGF